jgi:PGF-pre-PGF domain-containing protein
MKRGKLFLVLLLVCSLFILNSAMVSAADYYVNATTGNDGNAGTSPATAWKTISKLNAASFLPGDNIYFERGEVWREQLTVPSSGSSGNPITFGAYGSGEAPQINGFTDISGFNANDIPALISDMGGDSVINAIYDTRFNVASSGGVVDTWDDARGSGFGPQLTAFGTSRPAWDAVNEIITFDGINDGLLTLASPKFNLSTAKTLVVILSVPTFSEWTTNVDIGTSDDSEFLQIMQPWTNTYFGWDNGTFIDSGIFADGARRLVVVESVPGANFAITVPGAARSSGSAYDFTGLDYQLSVGNSVPGWNPSNSVVRAVIVIEGTLTKTQRKVLNDWAVNQHAVTLANPVPLTSIAQHTYTKTGITTEPKIVLRDGIPLVKGSDSYSLYLNQWYWADNTLTIRQSDHPDTLGQTIQIGNLGNLITTGTNNYITIDGLDLEGSNNNLIVGTGTNVIVKNSKLFYGSLSAINLAGDFSQSQYNIIGHTSDPSSIALNLAGQNSGSYHNTFYLNRGTTEKISSTGYTSKNNLKYLYDDQKYAVDVDSSVSDTPSIDYNFYYRPLQVQTGFHQELSWTTADHAIRSANVAGIGANIGRNGLYWNMIEYTQGVYDWSIMDNLVAEYQNNDIEPLFDVFGSPEWANGDSNYLVIPGNGVDATFQAWVNEYVTFMTLVATRYNGTISKWELWNEWNLDYFWNSTPTGPAPPERVEQYGYWYQAVYDAIKEVNPNAEISVGGMTGLYWDTIGQDFLQALFDQGRTIDYVSIHPYDWSIPNVTVTGTTEPPEADIYGEWRLGDFTNIDFFVRVLEKNNSTAEIWLTEWGWVNHPDDVSLSERAAWTPIALQMIRERYPLVTVNTFFMDKQLAGQPDNTGIWDSNLAPTIQVDVWEKNLRPLFDWKGTEYSLVDWQTESGQDANSVINTDPFFTSASGNDFTLQSTSPAIDAGVDVGLTQDFAGVSIPQGSAPDIGAYEYGNTSYETPGGNGNGDNGNGGNGGNGGGGGETSATPSIAENQTVEEITPQESIIFTGFNIETGIKQIEIRVKNEAQNVGVAVSKYDARPEMVPIEKEGLVYSYLEIQTVNLGDNLDKAIITFFVDKDWVTENDFDARDIALFLFEEYLQKWKELKTSYNSSDDDYYYYYFEAESDDFGYFLVGEEDKNILESKFGKTGFFLIVGGVIVLIIVLVVVISMILKKKGEVV